MHLSAYHFDGEPDVLLAAYDRMDEMVVPDGYDLHCCLVRDGGITVYDACPDRATAEAFSASEQFRLTLEHVGLPVPRVERLGDIHRARVLGGQVVA